MNCKQIGSILLMILFSQQLVLAKDMYQVICPMQFPEAMINLQEAIKEQHNDISRIQKVDKGLAKMGYASKEYRIVFFGRKERLEKIQQKHFEVLTILPLRFAIYTEGENTVVITSNPEIYKQLYKSKELSNIFMDWKQDIEKIIKALKKKCNS